MVLDEYLKEISAGKAREIGRDSRVLRKTLLEILAIVSPPPMRNAGLEAIFSVSTALAFTIWQHLGAMEWLSGSAEWLAENPKLWAKLLKGAEPVGLAVTHLANPERPQVFAQADGKGGFALSGTFPWVTGHGIFSRLIVGFQHGEEAVFALVDFPSPKNLPHGVRVEIEPVALGCLQGTATVKIHLENWNVRAPQIFGRRALRSQAAKRPTIYVFPELGIAQAALSECERILATRTGLSPEDLESRSGPVRRLHLRVRDLRAAAARGVPTDAEFVLRDECIRDAVRLLALTSGGGALVRESLAFRLQQEVLLLDAVIQPAAVRALKLRGIAGD